MLFNQMSHASQGKNLLIYLPALYFPLYLILPTYSYQINYPKENILLKTLQWLPIVYHIKSSSTIWHLGLLRFGPLPWEHKKTFIICLTALQISEDSTTSISSHPHVAFSSRLNILRSSQDMGLICQHSTIFPLSACMTWRESSHWKYLSSWFN